jgi:double-strand break repair protein MRE11
VANSGDIVTFKRAFKRNKNEIKPLDRSLLTDAYNAQDNADKLETRVEDIAEKYFKDVDESKQLGLLFSKGLSEMCRRLVDYDDDDAATNILE